MEKQCRRCKEIKPLTEFNKNSSQVDGLTRDCRDCTRQQQRDVRLRKRGVIVPMRKGALTEMLTAVPPIDPEIEGMRFCQRLQYVLNREEPRDIYVQREAARALVHYQWNPDKEIPSRTVNAEKRRQQLISRAMYYYVDLETQKKYEVLSELAAELGTRSPNICTAATNAAGKPFTFNGRTLQRFPSKPQTP